MAILKKAVCALALTGLLASVPAAAAQRKPAPVKADVRASAKVKKAERAVDTGVIVLGVLAAGAAAYGISRAVDEEPASP